MCMCVREIVLVCACVCVRRCERVRLCGGDIECVCSPVHVCACVLCFVCAVLLEESKSRHSPGAEPKPPHPWVFPSSEPQWVHPEAERRGGERCE